MMKSFDEIKQYLEYVLLGKPGTKAISQTSTTAYLWPFVEEVEKAVKALEIIKEKRVNVYWLFACFEEGGLERYNDYLDKLYLPECHLAQEEYDSIKGVLL